jgi:3-methyladenine DNA glycosylase AlkC
MASGFSLKDQLFNRDKTRYLAGLFAQAHPGFSAERFEAEVMEGLLPLELKARISWIAEVLGQHLLGPLPEVAPLILKALPPPLDPDKTDDDFGDFIFAPLGEFIVARGLHSDPALALDLLAEVTQRFSMEWAIRPFLNTHPDLTLARMQDWAAHPNYHLRRLVSEGTRPRLPWGQGVSLALETPLPLLEQLHSDPTRYVTRSVANHLNDISKKDPDLVLDVLEHWRGLDQQQAKELAWMTSHACRGLVKAGHPRALRVLGYDPDAEVAVNFSVSTEIVEIGDWLSFEVTLSSPEVLPVIVDYRMTFPRATGKVSQKVFKLKQTRLNGAAVTLTKRHRLKGDATTFKLHPGRHEVEILVNGRVAATGQFELTA